MDHDMTLKTIEDLIEYRRSKETPEERTERLRKSKERLDAMDKKFAQLERDLIPSEELLNRVINL